jgi:hypothetical protein
MPLEATIRTWRPQRFGRRAARHIDDPLVEPLWPGIRVLAHARPDGAEFVDADGGTQPWDEVSLGLAAALRADSAILDGYLTPEPKNLQLRAFSSGDDLATRDVGRRLFWVSDNRRRRQHEALQEAERQAERPPPIEPDDTIVFVAVDLLEVDGEHLLDVPLLERKRLLDAVVDEGPLARRGMHVRPPIEGWHSTWRALGFRAVAYKSANSRYRPGEPNDDWAIAPLLGR